MHVSELRIELTELGLKGPVVELLIANVIVGNFTCVDALRIGGILVGASDDH